MEKIAIINNLYFEQNKNLTEIAKIINTSVSYISRVLKKDERYKIEKEKRKNNNLLNRREKQKDLIYRNRKNSVDTDYISVQLGHINASKELSKHSSMDSQSLRKWCGNAYKFDTKKNCYKFDTENLLKPPDFPMYIKV